ncbi:MAG: GSCFA domain-containing protein [Bacteroidota bacterium]
MQFRTEIPLQPAPFQIDHQTKILSLGSCFAERIGQRLTSSKFDILSNPLGILYHPLALSKLLRMALGLAPTPDVRFAEHLDLWHSFDLHGNYRQREKSVLRSSIEKELANLKVHLAKTDCLLLTLGTAWVYETLSEGKMVANCHKYPNSYFKKRLLSVEEVVSDYTRLFAQLQNLRPKLNVILTVSPVRHQRDTLVLNSVSKSVLRLSAHQLSERLERVHYYPAYELLMDDLRDYRYYTKDLLHPNEQGEQYIWEHFGASFLSEKTQALLKRWDKLRPALSHRPFQAQGKAYRQFLENLLIKLQDLSDSLPLAAEIAETRAKLSALA